MSISVNGQSGVPPGFRFHPTEEELLNYYLRKKVASQEIDLDVIRDVDLNKLEPWDIQGTLITLLTLSSSHSWPALALLHSSYYSCSNSSMVALAPCETVIECHMAWCTVDASGWF
jgi:hypothetical protein